MNVLLFYQFLWGSRYSHIFILHTVLIWETHWISVDILCPGWDRTASVSLLYADTHKVVTLSRISPPYFKKSSCCAGVTLLSGFAHLLLLFCLGPSRRVPTLTSAFLEILHKDWQDCVTSFNGKRIQKVRQREQKKFEFFSVSPCKGCAFLFLPLFSY